MELGDNKIQLKTNARDLFFKKELSKLKIKVALNWFEIMALFLVSFFGILKVSLILTNKHIVLSIITAIIIATLITLLFSSFRKYQLKITRFDKEYIYKQISADLIKKSKS